MNSIKPLANPAPPKARSLSPRRRRLKLAFYWLAAGAIVLLGSVALLVWKNRPQAYRPDENPDGITRSLAQRLPPDAPPAAFVDVTAELGLSRFRSFSGERTSQLPEDMGPGLAWGDFDNDGDDDLFLVSAGGTLTQPAETWPPCELYENCGRSGFQKVTAFPEIRIPGMGASWGDYDGDGWLDLVVAGLDALLLFRNEGGTGAFKHDDRLGDWKGYWSGVAWGDFDNDRDLDLYVCGYVRYELRAADRGKNSQQLGTLVPYTLNPASYPPVPNLLFLNDGTGRFQEVAEQLGVSNPSGRSLGALWHDLDGDGRLDLYVANDISDNMLYRNLESGFEEISHRAWVADYRSAMGLAVGDWNRDGDDDLFVSHWVAQENALYDSLVADFQKRPAPPPRPSSGTPSESNPAASSDWTSFRFMDVTDLRGLGQVSIPYVGWGTEFVDLDGDGWLDLLVANGSTLETLDPPKRLKLQETFLFWNHRGQSFHNLAPLNPVLSTPHVARGLAVSDFDLDGDMDIAQVFLGEGVQLLRNDMQTGHWLEIRLRNRTADGRAVGFGDGSGVTVWSGGVGLRRAVTGASYLSQSSRTLHFGLGAVPEIERVEVRWLGGETNVYRGLTANAIWELTEGEPAPKRLRAPDQLRSASAGLAGSHETSGDAGPTATRLSRLEQARQPNGDTVLEPVPSDPKLRITAFWRYQRAAMDALKTEGDRPKAIRLLRTALRMNPNHEDSRYYLGQCLAAEGDFTGALEQLKRLVEINPQSHRGHQQWGVLRALSATSAADLAAAEESLSRAYSLNPEETGALLALGEIALLQGDDDQAMQRFSAACRTNPRAASGFFLSGYLAWKGQKPKQAAEFLQSTRRALGEEWKPAGTTSEGDVEQKWHADQSIFSRFWQAWNGDITPDQAFADLHHHLESMRARF